MDGRADSCGETRSGEQAGYRHERSLHRA
jgi:hypothetical protein